MKLMKTTLTVLLTLTLLIIFGAASAAEYTQDNLFTISYDDTIYELDNTSYLDESVDENNRWLFMLCGEDSYIDAYIMLNEDFTGFSLFSATDEEKLAYQQDTLEALADSKAELKATLSVSEYNIPFYLFSLEEDDGPVLMAETVVNGYMIDFYAYYEDEQAALDNALQNALSDILSTFTPVK